MDQDATGIEVGLDPSDIVLYGDCRACSIPRSAAAVSRQRPLRAVDVWRSYCESPVVVVDETRFCAVCKIWLKGFL